MNLYDRLKDEVKEEMLKEEAKYPSLISSMIKELKDEWMFLDDVSFRTVQHLCSWGKVEVSVINYYKLFD